MDNTIWIETGIPTHYEAVKVMNQLLEDYPLNDDEEFSVECYAGAGGVTLYAVKIIDKPQRGYTEAELAEARAEYLEGR